MTTQGWEKAIEEENDLQAVDRLVERFSVPLGSAGAQLLAIHNEFAEIMEYAVQYILLSTMDYKSVWWRVFNAFNATEWSNALLLVQLLFSLPASNGKLERVFSTVNVIKVNKRDNDSLDDLECRMLRKSLWQPDHGHTKRNLQQVKVTTSTTSVLSAFRFF